MTDLVLPVLQVELAPWRSNDHRVTWRGMRLGNVQHVFRFRNGFGASVVQWSLTYSGGDGLWELAVIVFDGDDYQITYDTPVTDDVIGYLDDNGVAVLLGRIAALSSEAVGCPAWLTT